MSHRHTFENGLRSTGSSRPDPENSKMHIHDLPGDEGTTDGQYDVEDHTHTLPEQGNKHTGPRLGS